jgi:hypothetical protein
MPGLIIRGQEIPINGLSVINYNDNPSIKLSIPGHNGRSRRAEEKVRAITLHVTGGPDGKPYWDNPEDYIKPGFGPGGSALGIIKYWIDSGVTAGAHLIVDFDGTIYCVSDLSNNVTYHATSVNWCTIGIEQCRGSHDGIMYEEQLQTTVKLVDALTRLFRIQRQFHKPYRPWKPVTRLTSKGGAGKDFYGIFGHRDQTDGRGPVDPGTPIFTRLEQAGYEPFDFQNNQDIDIWKQRQQQLIDLQYLTGPPDGLPGDNTNQALEAQGCKYGLLISRPSD